jgi:hypothetical protein
MSLTRIVSVVLGPAARLAALVPAAELPAPRDQLRRAGEVAAAQRLAFEDREEHLDQVQPETMGRDEVRVDTLGLWVS